MPDWHLETVKVSRQVIAEGLVLAGGPVDWFLAGKDDVRSSYYLEDVATEFHVQA